MNDDLYAHAKTLKTSRRSIMKELQTVKIPEHIKQTADGIFSELSWTVKSNRRWCVLAACIFQAYHENRAAVLPGEISALCGIKETMSKALSYVPDNFPVDKLKIYYPREYITLYADKAQMTFAKDFSLNKKFRENLFIHCKNIMLNGRYLEQKKPQEIAAAIVLHFFSLNGFKINKKMKVSFSGVSDTTITSAMKMVDEAYNKC